MRHEGKGVEARLGVLGGSHTCSAGPSGSTGGRSALLRYDLTRAFVGWLGTLLLLGACPEPDPGPVTLPPAQDTSWQPTTDASGGHDHGKGGDGSGGDGGLTDAEAADQGHGDGAGAGDGSGEALDGLDSGPSTDASGGDVSAELPLDVTAGDGSLDACAPSTCEQLAVECGQHDDGCGNTIDCGSLCVAYANGTAECSQAFTCEHLCDSGFHPCDDADGVEYCADSASPETCGDSCQACPVPVGAVATCDSGTCGISCEPGLAACTETCVDLTTDPEHCGECGTICPGGCADSGCIPVYTLTVVVGDGQLGVVDNTVPIPIQVELTDSGAPAGFVEIEFLSPEGAALAPSIAATNPSGIAFTTARLSREPGEHVFTARVAVSPATEVTFTATAEAPDDATIFSLVNWEHVEGNQGIAGAGTMARIGEPYGVAVATDGTVYFSDWTSSAHKVRALSPKGELTDIAGVDGGGGFAGDFGDALAAQLNRPFGVALDEVAGIVYVADTNNDRVRAIDLTNGTISTVAGGGSAVAPGYGDGGLAAFPPNGGAFIDAPTHLSLGPDGLLYVTDSKHDRVRRVDLAVNTIEAFVSAAVSGQKCDGQVVLTDCQVGCAMTWNEEGDMFLSGKFACGETEASINSGVQGIVRVEVDGTLHHVAGKASGSGGNNIPAKSAALGAVEGLALDPAGNLYISEGDTVRVIDAAIGRLSTVAGQAVAGSLGDFGLAIEAQAAAPMGLVFWGSHLIFADRDNFSVRTIWNTGAETVSSALLEIAGGNNQVALVDQQLAVPLSAKITDDSGGTLPGVPVNFQALVPGAGVVAPRAPAAANGVAAVVARPGLEVGPYHYEATFFDIHGNHVAGSPITFEVTAEAPQTGTLLTIVNTDGAAGEYGVPGAGTLARVGNVAGVAVASDGTVYFSQSGADLHRIRALGPAGQIYTVAGVGTKGFSGDNGPALLAEFDHPYGLVLDEVQQVLYVADSENDVVRAVELSGQKRITTYAGGGINSLEPYGDSGLALNATLDTPTHLALASDGSLFIADSERDRIRRVNGATGFVSTPLLSPDSPNNYDCIGQPVLRVCADTCALATDGSDNLYVIGQWACVTPTAMTASSSSAAIVRVAPNGFISHLVGIPTGSPSDVVSGGLNAKIGAGPGLAVDAQGNLYFSDDEHRVRWWDAASDTVETLTGQFDGDTTSGIGGFGGDYGPAIGGLVDEPRELALSPDGHLIFADFNNAAVRMIWGAIP